MTSLIEKSYSELQLINSLKKRDQKAFSYLYDHYAGSLYSSIFKIIADHNIADDVLQKVFINVWQKIDTYDPTRGRLFTWMLNITRNVSIDTLRSKDFRTHNNLLPLADDDHRYHYTTSTEGHADSIGIMKYVSRLKPFQKQLIVLIYLHGFSHAEVASMQRIPTSTIKTRVRAALMQLRRMVSEVPVD